MSFTSSLILGQVFLLLVGVAGGLLYYLNNINNELQDNLNLLREKLKDEKRHAKGLRVKIQEQLKKITALEQTIAERQNQTDDSQDKIESLESEYKSLLAQIESLEKDFNKKNKQLEKSNVEIESLKSKLAERDQKIEALNQSLNQSRNENVNENSGLSGFESLYFELKNAIAYNMKGGDEVLDRLRERLRENGNLEESDKLAELKEKYNAIGEMIGIVDDVVLFDEEEQQDAEQKDSQQIEDAEAIIKRIESTLQSASQLDEQDSKTDSESNSVQSLAQKLDEMTQVNQKLRADLSVTTNQLMAFISKAKVFVAQKEQIQLLKANQNQMHRNYVALSNDHKHLARKYKNLEAENRILGVKVKSDAPASELAVKLKELRGQLEDKEAALDRMRLENEMLEQQFLSVSEETSMYQETKSALARLTSEHELLEQQFLEILGEFEMPEQASEPQ